MNTLIINGSPRKNGDTAYIIEQLKEKMQNVDVVNSFDMDYSPCIDCGRCVSGKCIYDDEFTHLYEKIDDYDNIVLATPMYYNQPTGSLLMLMSRLQIIFNSKTILKPKNGGIVVVGGGDTVVNSADAEKTLRIILRGLNVDTFAYIRSLRTSVLPAREDKSIEIQIDEFINILKSYNN